MPDPQISDSENSPVENRNRERWKAAENVALREFFNHHHPCRSANLCWVWPRYRDAKGYGCIIYDGFKFPVHRLSFRHYKGAIPKGFVVMHECDNPSCFNPKHLYLGTQQDNVDDMMRKGRHASHARRLPESDRPSWAWENPGRTPRGLSSEQIEQRKKLENWLRSQAEKGIA